MSYLYYLLGFLPSIIWLLYYLRKDVHPESNRMILKIFFLGMAGAVFAFFLEKVFQKANDFLVPFGDVNFFLNILIGGALIEEYVKYLVVKGFVLRDSALDEPTDLMIYMIISALGFAALENILLLLSQSPALKISGALGIAASRFLTATFLHALVSAMFGYFLAISFCRAKKRFFWIGLGLATVLHCLYNFSIMKIAGLEKFIIPVIILLGLALVVSLSFKKLKRLKGTCRIKLT